MRKTIFILLLLFVAIAAMYFLLPVPAAMQPQNFVTIRDQQFAVEVARTPESQARGLSGHAPLTPDEGMLFPFPTGSTPGFWMKDMLFPIDIIWIVDDQVVGFVERAMPDDRPNRTTYYPPKPITEVLEVAAGTVARFGIQVGDEVQFNVNPKSEYRNPKQI